MDFLLHRTGLASEWASRAQVGDRLHIGGPGGGNDIDLKLASFDLDGLLASGSVKRSRP